MKKNIIMLLAFTLIFGLLFIGGCSGDTSAPADSGEGEGEGEEEVPEEANGPTAEEPVTLVFATWEQPTGYLGEIYQQAADKIEEETGGRVVMDCYFSGSLLEYADVFSGVASGRADIATAISSMATGKLNQIFDQPYIGIPDQIEATKAFKELLATHPEFQEEMEQNNTRWISLRAMPPYWLHMVTKPVRVPDDLKGMKIMASGDTIVEESGGASIDAAPPDMYMNLERGLADGQITHWNAVVTFGLKELYNYHTSFGGPHTGLKASAIGWIINLDTWNSLPPDIQETIVEVYEWADAELGKHVEGEEAMAWSKEQGHEFIEVTGDDLVLWEEKAQPTVEKWIEEVSAEGWPAAELWDSFGELIEKHR
ncbi:MAG: TRAP transporter substrate-binding protein DctP [Bacillota bacterium]|nr:TRAP transporter substrate-binding protein DctP [Bacillota bacterium]